MSNNFKKFVKYRGNPRLRVVVGMHTEIVFIDKIVIHNDYNWVNLHNDIAILHLEKGLDLSNLFPSVGKVCLPTSEGLFKEHKERYTHIQMQITNFMNS